MVKELAKEIVLVNRNQKNLKQIATEIVRFTTNLCKVPVTFKKLGMKWTIFVDNEIINYESIDYQPQAP